MRTYSTADVASDLAGDSMKEPERWLLRQISRGRVQAMKIGRHWRMTDEQVELAREVFSNLPKSVAVESEALPEVVPLGRPSAGSLRRRRVS